MLKFIGAQPPNSLTALVPSAICPHCNTGTRFTISVALHPRLRQDNAGELIAGYSCDVCSRAVGILWKIKAFDPNGVPVVFIPEMIQRVLEPFAFTHIPEEVRKEISEGLNCLSVNSHNGFAAMCLRAIQSMCTSLGTEGSTKVQSQINALAELVNLEDETRKVALEVMLTGHDGSHPHLPDVNENRAAVLLALLRDLSYQLFTRPGKLKESAELRRAAIQEMK